MQPKMLYDKLDIMNMYMERVCEIGERATEKANEIRELADEQPKEGILTEACTKCLHEIEQYGKLIGYVANNAELYSRKLQDQPKKENISSNKLRVKQINGAIFALLQYEKKLYEWADNVICNQSIKELFQVELADIELHPFEGNIEDNDEPEYINTKCALPLFYPPTDNKETVDNVEKANFLIMPVI